MGIRHFFVPQCWFFVKKIVIFAKYNQLIDNF